MKIGKYSEDAARVENILATMIKQLRPPTLIVNSFGKRGQLS